VPTRAPRARPTVAARAATATPVPPTPAPTAVPTASPSQVAEQQAKAAYQAFLVEDFKQAEATAREALRVNKDNALALSVLAGAAAVDGVNQKKSDRLAEADDAASRALKLDEGQALAHNAKGLVAWGKNDAEGAQRAFEKATQLDPRLGAASTNLAYLQFQKKQYKDAEKSYRAAIKANPESAVPYNGLAQVLLEQNKAGDAAKASREAISRYELRDPYLGAFYVNLAVALYQQRKQDEALEAVARARGLGLQKNAAYEVIEKGPLKSK
jgi:tetratricopeptide (TPR) repeat protein